MDLLKPEEASLLRAMARFRAGFTEGMLARVWSDNPNDSRVQLLIGNLIRVALVRSPEIDNNEVKQYRMFEVIREYAAYRLNQGPTIPDLPDQSTSSLDGRYVEAYATYVTEIYRTINSTEEAIAFRAIDVEFDNVRHAIELALSAATINAKNMQMIDCLWKYCGHRGLGSVQLDWYTLARSLPLESDIDTDLLLDVLIHTGNTAIAVGDMITAEQCYSQMLVEAERTQNYDDIGVARGNLALVYERSANYELALQEAISALEYVRKHEALKPEKSATPLESEYVLIGNIGSLLRALGRYTEAIERYQESILLQEPTPTATRFARTLCECAYTMALAHRFIEANSNLARALKYLTDVESHLTIPIALSVGLELAAGCEDLEPLACLLGAFDAAIARSPATMEPQLQACRERAQDVLLTLNAEAYTNAYKAGFATTNHNALELLKRAVQQWNSQL